MKVKCRVHLIGKHCKHIQNIKNLRTIIKFLDVICGESNQRILEHDVNVIKYLLEGM